MGSRPAPGTNFLSKIAHLRLAPVRRHPCANRSANHSLAALPGETPIGAGLAPGAGMKERGMRFQYAMSYESDTAPIETLRGELDA